MLSADGDALHQVFLNLYTNAVQAMPHGGELAIEAKRIDRELVIRIKDTGSGIPADQIDRIFEPFFTTKDQEPDPALRGSGLGLSVSYSIVEAHGGTLEVESEVNHGAVFTVRLPALSLSKDLP
jgi:signal transduction histidine kinase